MSIRIAESVANDNFLRQREAKLDSILKLLKQRAADKLDHLIKYWSKRDNGAAMIGRENRGSKNKADNASLMAAWDKAEVLMALAFNAPRISLEKTIAAGQSLMGAFQAPISMPAPASTPANFFSSATTSNPLAASNAAYMKTAITSATPQVAAIALQGNPEFKVLDPKVSTLQRAYQQQANHTPHEEALLINEMRNAILANQGVHEFVNANGKIEHVLHASKFEALKGQFDGSTRNMFFDNTRITVFNGHAQTTPPEQTTVFKFAPPAPKMADLVPIFGPHLALAN